MGNILVPKLFGVAKNFRFSSFAPPSSVRLYCLFNVTSSGSYDVTFHPNDVELFQNIIHDFLTKLGIFYSIISLWHVQMFAARGLSYKLELLVNIEMFSSLLNWLYIIKRKFKCFC